MKNGFVKNLAASCEASGLPNRLKRSKLRGMYPQRFKGHGLGNDYLVMNPEELDFSLTPTNIRAICDRHRGVGSDGILTLAPSSKADFGLRIYNPDGSEAEKSGNGLRIFARYLHATHKIRRTTFTVETKGGVVRVVLHLNQHREASAATVEMGQATFQPQALPCILHVD